MKRIAITVTILLVLVATGYLAFDKWYKNDIGTLWDNVPDNAVLVFESDHAVESWNQLMASPLWKSLKKMESFKEMEQNIKLLDSIGANSGGLSKLLKENSLISLHVTGKNSFDFTFFFDLSTPSSQGAASGLLQHYKEKEGIKYSERIYQEFKISELASGNTSFTYLIHNNILMGSFTSYLVEDVVRLINSDFKTSFNRSNHELFSLPKLSNDEGNIYLNIEEASLWLSTFITSEKRVDSRQVKSLGSSMFLDVDQSDKRILFNGFTTYSKDVDFLSTFSGQKPVNTDVKRYIPNRASVLYQYGFSDPISWEKGLIRYWETHDPQFYSGRKSFEKNYNISLSQIYEWMGTNLNLITLEPMDFSGSEKLAFVHSADVNEALKYLNRFSESLAQAHGDSVYLESFAEYEFRELKVSDFPKYAFGPLFDGFKECYFTVIGNYVVLATSMQTLKSLVEDIESENTWGRSVAFNNFLEGTLEETNLSMIFNTRRIWEYLLGSQLNPKWKEIAVENEHPLKSFNLGAIQFSRLDENFYTSIVLQYEEQPELKEKTMYDALKSTSLNNKIITKPYVVRNHVDNTFEVAVQDSAYNFVLIAADGNVLWRDSLGEPITSDIEQIDYYKNGKLQYFFTTKSGIHIIDRLGNYIDGFPVKLENAIIKYASVVDYDKSKRYRFLLAGERGNLYLYNKQGISLEGWGPRELAGKPASKPFHIRVRGRDCIVAVQQDGIVNIMNRRGEMLPGFPLNLDARINTMPFVNIGSDFDKTIFTLISKEGRLIKFNLKGTVTSTEQLYKPTKETTFEMVPDALGKTYIIVRQDMSRLVLLTPDHNEILAKDYLSSDQLYVQYYDLGSDHKIYAITDKTQDFTYLYDRDGKLISSQPFTSEQEIALMYFNSTGKYQIYVVAGDTFKILTF